MLLLACSQEEALYNNQNKIASRSHVLKNIYVFILSKMLMH